LGVVQYIKGKVNMASVGSVSYTAEQRLCGVRSYIVESPLGGVKYTANWRSLLPLYVLCNSQIKLGASWWCKITANWHQVYFALYVLCNSKNKLGASWRCILHRQTVTPQCKILHHAVVVQRCKIHCQLAPSLLLLCLICTVQLPK